MNRFIEYTTHHPLLVAAAALAAIIAIVMELRQRALGTNVIASSDAVRLLNSGALAIDVRSATEFEAGHIIDARNVPTAEIATRAESLKKFKEKPVLVYCDSGTSSAAAVKALQTQGFTKVVALRGGLQTWRQDNLPLVKGAAKKEGKNA